jgi:Mn-dependent DtxR family transcriptional regulator
MVFSTCKGKRNHPIRKMMELYETERAILRVVKEWQRRYRNSPTNGELAQVLKMQEREVALHVGKLQDKGYVDVVCPAGRKMIVPLYWE